MDAVYMAVAFVVGVMYGLFLAWLLFKRIVSAYMQELAGEQREGGDE